jgi:hypothetical protein
MSYREFLVLGLDLYPRHACVCGGHARYEVAVVTVAERVAAVRDVYELPLPNCNSRLRVTVLYLTASEFVMQTSPS